MFELWQLPCPATHVRHSLHRIHHLAQDEGEGEQGVIAKGRVDSVLQSLQLSLELEGKEEREDGEEEDFLATLGLCNIHQCIK